MLFSSTFNGDDEPLHAMQRAGLIRIHRKNVVDVSHRDDVLPVVRQKMFVQPARPLFIEAFRRVVQDPTLSSGIQLQVGAEWTLSGPQRPHWCFPCSHPRHCRF